MNPAEIGLRRLPIMLRPDPGRVIVRAFFPASEPRDLHRPDPVRADRITARVLAMEQDEVEAELAATLHEFGGRHRNLRTVFAVRFDELGGLVPDGAGLSVERRLLIGAYFSHEYSFEAAALFNPSIVAHPDQSGLASGELRFVLSLRATGEGHVSSISFRSGIVDGDGEVRLDPCARYATTPRPDALWTAGDDDDVVFPPDTDLSERVIFPMAQRQRNGLEDARFVRFIEDDGAATYYATYTAYSGREIVPELLRTDDFLRFRFLPHPGRCSAQQGHGAVPASRRRPVRDAGPAGWGEPPARAVGRPPRLERCNPNPEAGAAMGVRADRQLRQPD